MKGKKVLGNCYLCGKSLGKTAMKNHVFKDHAAEAGGQSATLFRVEGRYSKNYWLLVDVADTATLANLDSFLRNIWLDCCGHLSAFMGRMDEIPMDTRIRSFLPGEQFSYDYDFGSTTELSLTVMGKISRPKQKKPERLLARNAPPEIFCACGKPAEFVCQECLFGREEEHPFYCETCMDKHGHDIVLPVTNSPRMGECAYDGMQDAFDFVPPEKNEKADDKPSKTAKKAGKS